MRVRQHSTGRWSTAALLVGGAFAIPLMGCAVEEADLGSESFAVTASGDVILQWDRVTSDVVAANEFPFHMTRTFAMVTVAMHDAVNGVTPKYEQHTFHGQDKKANAVAAAASAA